MPLVELGPLETSTFPFSGPLHRLLGKEGVFAFDFSPSVTICNTRADGRALFTITCTDKDGQSEINHLIKDSPYSSFFAGLQKGELQTSITCKAHKECPEKPCTSLISQIAKESIGIVARQKEVGLHISKFMDEMSKKPKAILTEEELAVRKIGNQNFTLSEMGELRTCPLINWKRALFW